MAATFAVPAADVELGRSVAASQPAATQTSGHSSAQPQAARPQEEKPGFLSGASDRKTRERACLTTRNGRILDRGCGARSTTSPCSCCWGTNRPPRRGLKTCWRRWPGSARRRAARAGAARRAWPENWLRSADTAGSARRTFAPRAGARGRRAARGAAPAAAPPGNQPAGAGPRTARRFRGGGARSPRRHRGPFARTRARPHAIRGHPFAVPQLPYHQGPGRDFWRSAPSRRWRTTWRRCSIWRATRSSTSPPRSSI